MKTFILFFLIITQGHDVTNERVHTQEFNSKQTCEEAIRTISLTTRDYGRKYKLICLEK